ncbi:tektin-1 [Clupea harengus]|uniref:Tektin n=1 Tax=Clupea harengus TaxID=7950 RepID=A0A6P8G0Q9_CLUHA|nr:tektin-1 [Clupea harengus]
MSRLREPPPKFLPREWKHANDVHYGNAESERIRSELLTADSQRLMEQCDRATKRMQEQASKRLEQRIHDIKFWKLELDKKLDEVVHETENLITCQSRVHRALESCSEPLRVTMQGLVEREKRVGIDLVHDEVEQELMREKEVIEGVAALLQRTLEQTIEQIRLNRSAKYYLEKDMQDKFQAEKIDDFCTILTSTYPKIECGAAGFETSLASNPVTPDEWETFSDINICKAEKQRTNSVSLRSLVESLLQQTATDMSMQHEATGNALEMNVQRIKSSKAMLEDHLSKVLAELASQERNLEDLHVAIADKQGPLKVAQARLTARSLRPNVELCHDSAQSQLLSEVQKLISQINSLKEAQSEAEMELRALARSQLALEEEIQIKSHSLYIDEVICTQLHLPIFIHNF